MGEQQLAIDPAKMAQKLDTLEQIIVILTDEMARLATREGVIEALGLLRAELNLYRVDEIISPAPVQI